MADIKESGRIVELDRKLGALHEHIDAARPSTAYVPRTDDMQLAIPHSKSLMRVSRRMIVPSTCEAVMRLRSPISAPVALSRLVQRGANAAAVVGDV